MRVDGLPWQRLSSLAAFMVPGLALWLPSGYSWGALLLLLCSLVGVRQWWRRPLGMASGTTWALAGSFALIGLVWMLDVDGPGGLRNLDRAAKYVVALPCLFYLLACPPRVRSLWWGMTIGAMGSGLLALYQTGVLGMERAGGFSNAIQYGNLSLALGLMCALVWCALGANLGRWQAMALAVATALGLLGSLLSMSRGGWLALGLSLPLWGWLLWRWAYRPMLLRAAALGTLGLLVALVLQGPQLYQRWVEARTETQNYLVHDQANSSVGQRLDHWRLAWAMGWDRPWTGWGRAGYTAEKQQRVAAGQAHPSVLAFDHGHNEFLDLWAKRGLPGVLALLLLYAVPAAIFWPTRARLRSATGLTDRTTLALRLTGLALPVLYCGFGLTQAFLKHNSGNMFYLFMLILIFTSLQARQAQRQAPL